MHVSRILSAIAGAATLSVALTGVVAADTVTGQIGHYLITDSQSTPGANCRYAQVSSSTWRIYRVVVKPPSVWWPDTNSTNNTQHGPVGWQAVLRHKSPSSSTWLQVKKSTIQHATAYEDHPLYDPADKAPFTKIVLDFNGANFPLNEQFRVNVKIYWFSKLDGSVKGSVTHSVNYYGEIVSGTNFGTVQGYCVDAFQVA